MKKLLLFTIVLCVSSTIFSQNIFGKWKTIDDETGEEKSIVEIYESNGKVYGKIIDILNPKKKNSVCNKCEGDKKGKPVMGMQIIDGLVEGDHVYEDGTILNPSNGKVYKCRLKLDGDKDTLQVRGYVAFFYKTQYWKRVK